MSIRNGKVAYKSPIDTIVADIEMDYWTQFDNSIIKAVQNVGITVDKEELVKALAYDRDQYQKGWSDRDADIVRCKDCKYRIVNEHYGERGYMMLKAYCDLDTGDPFELGRCAEDDNWFCADGERRSDETD